MKPFEYVICQREYGYLYQFIDTLNTAQKEKLHEYIRDGKLVVNEADWLEEPAIG